MCKCVCVYETKRMKVSRPKSSQGIGACRLNHRPISYFPIPFSFLSISLSVTGKKLMAKCRSLLQENAELGKQVSQGRVAQLETEIALHKKHNQEIKAAQDGERGEWTNGHC